jgi:aldose 1-epimerase
MYTDARPSRSGIPILVPFPNRIRDGRYTWEGKQYQLPINDSQQRNAIHGFVCQRPWRVIGAAASATGAWVKGIFQGSMDAPDCRSLWPADYVLEATYTLKGDTLRLDLVLANPDTKDLPFGLGLHPYFRFPADQAVVHVEAPKDGGGDYLQRWELEACLPGGQRTPLADKDRLLVAGTCAPLGTTAWDDAYRLVSGSPATPDLAARVVDPADDLALRMTTSGGFPDVVVFTPPHRAAVCVEPYTCITDAINLQGRGVDAGLMVLTPKQEWRGRVSWEKTGAGK